MSERAHTKGRVEYWWLIEMPDTDGSSLYLTMLPGINQTAFRPDPWKATRFKRQADAEAHASRFYKPGFGVRAVEHAFEASPSGYPSHAPPSCGEDA